jgi:hypothetical protein
MNITFSYTVKPRYFEFKGTKKKVWDIRVFEISGLETNMFVFPQRIKISADTLISLPISPTWHTRTYMYQYISKSWGGGYKIDRQFGFLQYYCQLKRYWNNDKIDKVLQCEHHHTNTRPYYMEVSKCDDDELEINFKKARFWLNYVHFILFHIFIILSVQFMWRTE